MDFLGGLLGGDMTGSMMQGFKMAQMEKQYKLAEQKQRQDYELNKLLKEEQALKIKAQRNLLEEGEKIKQGFMPQTVARTNETASDYETGEQAPATQSFAQEPSLIKYARRVHGDEVADMAMEMAKYGRHNEALALITKPPNKGEWLTTPEGATSTNLKTGQVIQGNKKVKAPTVRQMNVGGEEVTQQWDPDSETWKEVARGPKWNPDKPDKSSTEYDRAVKEYNAELKALETRYQSSKNSLGGEMPTEEWNRQMRDIRARWEPLIKKYGGRGFDGKGGGNTSNKKPGKPPLSSFER